MDNRFISPPGALRFTNKKYLVTEEDHQEAQELFEYAQKEMKLTPIDKTTLELIRARKKQDSHSSSVAQS